MNFCGLLLRLLPTVLSTALVFACDQLYAQPLDPTKVTWSELHYEASKLFITVNSEIKFDLIDSKQTMTQLHHVPAIPAKMPTAPSTVKLTLDTHYLSVNSNIQTWMNPNTELLQRTSNYTGSKRYYRLIRYTPDGSYTIRGNFHRKKNSSAEEPELSPPQFIPLPDLQPNPIIISDSEALFYRLNQLEQLKIGDEIKMYLLDSGSIVEVILKTEAFESLKVDFAERKSTGKQQFKQSINVAKLRLTAFPYHVDEQQAKDKRAVNIRFLGIDGDVDIYFDPIRKIIVQISGDLKYVGRVDIRLAKVVYR